MIGTDIQKAYTILKSGGLVSIPTETVYGLAANGFDLEAITEIFEVKNRPFFDPLILHCSDMSVAMTLFKSVPAEFYSLMNKYWPGPLTLVGEKSDSIPDLVTAGSSLVAVRVPNHPLTLELLEMLDFPLAAPSANPFGYISPTTPEHVEAQLGDKIEYILDGGSCEIGIESTIVGINKGKLEIWRLGGISKEEIENIIGYKVQVILNQNSNPAAPGQLDKHYSPKADMLLYNGIDFKHKINQLSNSDVSKIGLLVFGDFETKLPFAKVLNLSVNESMTEAATNLYAFMRQLDSLEINTILAMRMPTEGIGRAINDRLERASAK